MNTLKLHPKDNCAVALKTLPCDTIVRIESTDVKLMEDIAPKHKFAITTISKGEPIYMYGIKIGVVVETIKKGEALTALNVAHDTSKISNVKWRSNQIATDISNFQNRTFNGYHRQDGQVGTQNIWLVIPLVFCENRNIKIMEEAFLEELGFTTPNPYKILVRSLIGKEISEPSKNSKTQFFQNIDGIKFLTHQSGCGGTREDALILCKLIAGYINNANVAGATILSLGCQNAQLQILQEELKRINAKHGKTVLYFEQQQLGSEKKLLTLAITQTFEALSKANKQERQPSPLSKLVIGLECGGSDGFSGISANPVVGHVSDIVVTLGGSSILAEFPELCGVEQQLLERMPNKHIRSKFTYLMKTYAQRAEAVGSGFDMNPSPGNIKDGLITDAMKSAGAAKKGGTATIADVLDYTEQIQQPGLQLLCTPGNDVESTTGLAASGANIILFTTGLGTPTGNPVAPTIKISSNSQLTERMADIIDFDTGKVITAEKTIEELGENLLERIIKVASGEEKTKAQQLQQDDFIPWKRGISL